MSEPDIYTIKLADQEPEKFVKHSDYMKLHESWKQMFFDGIQVLRQEREELALFKSEVDRLRKAGDAMADQIYNEGKTQGICYASNIEAWNAAKEGKPSV